MFALKNPDDWSDFLSGSAYPDGVSPEEFPALEAAHEQLEAVVVELRFISLARSLSSRLEKCLPKPGFKRASTKPPLHQEFNSR